MPTKFYFSSDNSKLEPKLPPQAEEVKKVCSVIIPVPADLVGVSIPCEFQPSNDEIKAGDMLVFEIKDGKATARIE